MIAWTILVCLLLSTTISCMTSYSQPSYGFITNRWYNGLRYAQTPYFGWRKAHYKRVNHNQIFKGQQHKRLIDF